MRSGRLSKHASNRPHQGPREQPGLAEWGELAWPTCGRGESSSLPQAREIEEGRPDPARMLGPAWLQRGLVPTRASAPLLPDPQSMQSR